MALVILEVNMEGIISTWLSATGWVASVLLDGKLQYAGGISEREATMRLLFNIAKAKYPKEVG